MSSIKQLFILLAAYACLSSIPLAQASEATGHISVTATITPAAPCAIRFDEHSNKNALAQQCNGKVSLLHRATHVKSASYNKNEQQIHLLTLNYY